MDDKLDKRLGAAVAAGWRTAVLGAVFFMIAWAIMITMLHYRPSWVLTVWGGQITWDDAREATIWFFTVLKLLWFLFILAIVYLAIWRSQLKKEN